MRFMGVLSLVAVTACYVRPAYLAPAEKCGASLMVVEGLVASSGQATAVAYNNAGGAAYARGVSYEESVSCRRPATQEERCEAEAGRASALIKLDFDPRGRNVLVYLGYLAFLVPGLLLYATFDGTRDDVIGAARDAFGSALAECMSRTARPVAASEPVAGSVGCSAYNTGLAALPYTTDGAIPDGATEDEAIDAAVQFATATGMPIADRDYRAHTMTTQRIVGQTRTSNCGVSQFFSYDLRVVVNGRSIMITMGCWESKGRGEPQQVCQLIPESDVAIPNMLIAGMISMMRTRHQAPAQPQPAQPPANTNW
jgi:hypothetical protein